jgi:hypothetical protein
VGTALAIARDEARASRESRADAWLLRNERERRALPRSNLQIWSPALADIIGARRAWTVAMISSVSMPCR